MRIAFTYSLKTAATEDQAEYDTPETVAMIEAAPCAASATRCC